MMQNFHNGKIPHSYGSPLTALKPTVLFILLLKITCSFALKRSIYQLLQKVQAGKCLHTE